MMKKILFFLLIAVFSLGISAQAPSKKCPVCGLSIPKCQYKGKHPKEKPTKLAPTDKKCPVCGLSIHKCQYKGKHPKKKPTTTAPAQQQSSKPAKPAKPINQSAKPVNQPAKPTPVPTLTRPTTGTINGYEWVDLGLSVRWATQNVGASSPSDYGDYFAWGETEPKSSYDWSNCFDCRNKKGTKWGIYKIGGKTSITPDSGHDTARANWGGSWRMPTDAELEELCNKCTWTWTSQGGHSGYKVTGPNGNSIFLPAAGWRVGADTVYVGEHGTYRSSSLSLSGSDLARGLYFDSGDHHTGYSYRSCGLSVRPVTD